MTFSSHSLSGSGRLFERAGTFLSFACAVHCMATPILLTLLPLAARAHLTHHHLEMPLLAGSALLGAFVLWRARRRHRQPRPLVLFGGAFGLMALAKIGHAAPAALLLTVLGSLLLGWAYWDNHLASRRCPCCTTDGAV